MPRISDPARPGTPGDGELLAAANRGEPAAMEALYFRYRDWVHARAWRLTGNREDALDVLQEVFLYFFRKFPGLELNCELKTFLYPVVRSLALDRRRRRRETPLGAAAAELAAPAGREEAAERAELSALLGPLPEEQREVVLLRFADGFSLQEIAKALAVPLGTVKSRLHHALGTLRGSLRR